MPQRILGVDPGTVRAGYGLVEEEGGTTTALAWGVLAPGARRPLGERLLRIYQGLLDLIDRWSPSAVAVEDPFFPRLEHRVSARSILSLGQAQAAVLMAAAQRGLPLFRYPPARVKQAVTDYGRGSKAQVQEMVRLILDMPEPPSPSDAADALAVALCHLQQARLGQLLASGGAP